MTHKRQEGRAKPIFFKAGVLPFRVTGNENQRDIEYLLGKEAEADNYKFSNTWSAFEGGSKPKEAPENTAAREFLEESCGCFNPYSNLEGLILALNRRKYTLRVTCRTRPDSLHRSNTLYALQVPRNTACIKTFTDYQARVRALIQDQKRLQEAEEQLKTNKHFLFKASVVPDGVQNLIVNAVTEICRSLVRGSDTLSITFQYETSGEPEKTGLAVLKINLAHYTSADIEEVKKYMHWQSEKEKFEGAAQQFVVDYPAAMAVEVHATEGGAVQSIRLNQDCMEKSEVRWWSSKDISEACAEGRAKFRPSFLEIFKIANSALTDALARET